MAWSRGENPLPFTLNENLMHLSLLKPAPQSPLEFQDRYRERRSWRTRVVTAPTSNWAPYLRVMELNAAKQKVDGEDGATKANEVDFSRSTTFIMDRLNYLTDLDLASFLNVNQPIFSKEGRAAYIKHCEEKGCTPAFLHRALTTALSVDQQQQLSDCFHKIRWKLDSTYQVMFNYEERGACATAVKS